MKSNRALVCALVSLAVTTPVLGGAGSVVAGPWGEGPVPQLAGTWQSQAPNNNYVIRVGWNAATGRYEGTLVRQGFLSARSVMVVGEVCWIASPVSNQPYLQGAEEIRLVLPGGAPRPQWRRAIVRLEPRNPNILFSGGTRFFRVGSPAPVVPVRAGSSPPDSPFVATPPPPTGRPGEKPSVKKGRAVAETQPTPVAGSDAQNLPGSDGSKPALSARQARTSESGPGMQFPSVEDVTASTHGSNVKDTAARQEATFTLLDELLEDVYHGNMNNPTQGMPPDRAALYGQYKQAANRAEEVVIPGKSATENMSSPATSYYFSLRFRREVLSRYAPQAIVDDYEKVHWAGQEAAAAAGARRSSDAAAAEDTKRSLAPDLKKARDHHTDLSVFGVQLGEVMNLPNCSTKDSDNDLLSETLLGSSAARTCVVDKAGSFSQGLAQFIAASNSVPWVSSGISVKLGMAQCPNWMKQAFGCSIIFNVRNGVALGATFQTNGVQYETTIIEALSRKYGAKNRHEGGEMWCQNTLTGIKTDRAHEQHWDVEGILHVSYEPIHACTNGRISVELNRFRQERANVERKMEESGPKM